jgi:cysteinyl-tRNA synthetase
LAYICSEQFSKSAGATMTQFLTSHGAISVTNWGYQLQGNGGASLNATQLAAQTHDLIVMDFSADGTTTNAFTSTQIGTIQNGSGGQTVAISYISIGEASEFRDHWQTSWTSDGTAAGNLTGTAPAWLGPNNPDWPESRKVRYWDTDWQNEIFNNNHTGWLDHIVSNGFDAAYLDIVDAYYFWGAEALPGDLQPGDPASLADSAIRMIDFIIAMADHARQTNPYFFVVLQNGESILDDAGTISAERKARFLDAVGAIGVEDVYNPGNLDENNAAAPDADRITALQDSFLANNIPVFVTDYLNTPALVTQFETSARADGFIPYTAPHRALDVMGPEYSGALPTETYHAPIATAGADALVGKNPDDIINGLNGNDFIFGGGGDDELNGGAGNDHIDGGVGNDILTGGAGIDVLIGGIGDDAFIFDAADSIDGGDGFDILLVESSSVPTSFDLAAHNLEAAAQHVVDTTGQSWTDYVRQFDQNWNPVSEEGNNDDGGRWKTTWDTAGNQSWSQRTTTYDAANHIISQSGIYDNTRTWNITYDVDNNQDWSKKVIHRDIPGGANWVSKTTLYDDLNRVYDQTGTYDSGRKWHTVWDVANNEIWTKKFTYIDTPDSTSWSRKTQHYNAQNKVYEQFGTYDTGRTWHTVWDHDNAEIWSKAITFSDVPNATSWLLKTYYYNNAGHLYEQSGLFDNGLGWITRWDAENTEIWSKQVGRLDAANDYSWSSKIYKYDDSNRLYEYDGAYDDGRTWITLYDVNNNETWAKQYTLYDSANNYSWDHKIYQYDAVGNLLNTQIIDDIA